MTRISNIDEEEKEMGDGDIGERAIILTNSLRALLKGG